MSGARTGPRTAFRPDVQGMRALAVSTVILAHAGVGALAGGYVGVDVFFVISGFLITSLLWREVTASGSVSLRRFYERRARRILPAATVVTVLTLGAALVWLPLLRALEVLYDGLWSALFVANFRFAAVGTDYFAKGESPSPLQHMWSLAVEEQFYLVWPVALAGLLWWARRRGRPVARGPVLGFLGAVVVLSLAWSVLQTGSNPTFAYFSSLTRAWELAAGSLAAVALAGRRPSAPRWLLEAGAWLGLALIAVAVLAFEPSTPFPGYAAAVPTAGAVLLLVTGAVGPTSVGALLSLRPCQLVGDWSYSLYLWHWPVLILAPAVVGTGRTGGWWTVLAVALVFVLGWASFRWIETPFRRSPPRASRPLPRRWLRGVALYPLSFAIVCATVLGGRWYIDDTLGGGSAPAITVAQYGEPGDSPDPTVALVEASVDAARAGAPVPGDLAPSLVGLREQTAPLGACDYRTGTTRLCNAGDQDAERAIVVLGDSHARAWSPALSEIGRRHGYATYNLVLTGCPAAQVVQGDQATDRPFEACQEFKAFSLEQIEELRPALVVVSSSSLGPVIDTDGTPIEKSDPDRFRELYRAGMDAELARLQDLADRVVVLGDTPFLPREPGQCLSERGVDLGDCMMTSSRFQHVLQNDYRKVADERGVQFISARKWFCVDTDCPAVVGRTITMRDREHMTPTYAEALAEPLASRLGITAS